MKGRLFVYLVRVAACINDMKGKIFKKMVVISVLLKIASCGQLIHIVVVAVIAELEFKAYLHTYIQRSK